MNEKIKNEIINLINKYTLNCSLLQFQDKVNWLEISANQKLSEEFIREFKDNVNWYCISANQKLSEEFIREFQDKVVWSYISAHQKLSEEFMREFKEKVVWNQISAFQKLSEEFIREFQEKVVWNQISAFQKLSEQFIKEFKDKVDWYCISANQKLSEEFIREFKEKVVAEYQRTSFKEKTIEQKKREMQDYAKKHNLNFDGEFLFAYRKHDVFGRGSFNRSIFYEIGKYYRDWHCDMNEKNQNSFGLGIWPKNKGVNILIKVSVEDWGCEVEENNGKARVFGFTVLNEIKE